MAFSEDIQIDNLLKEVRRLFQGQTPEVTPSSESVAGGYQAPLKGSWRSSGGFDPVSMRPNGRKGHMGVDMRAPAGTPIYPMAPGVVTSVGTDPLGGNVVNVQHANGVRTYYAHLSTVKVQKGDKVDYNTVLGGVGQTGNAKGTYPHCHFQVWKDNQIQDPAKFFTVPPYTPISQQEARNTWVSEEAKQEAANFDMRRHVSQKRVAFSRKLDRLLICAQQYYKLVSGQSKS